MRLSFSNNKSIINIRSVLITLGVMLLAGIVFSVVQITVASPAAPNPGHTWAQVEMPADCTAGYYVYGASSSGWKCSQPSGGGSCTITAAGGLTGGGSCGAVTLSLYTGSISSCTNTITSKIIWDAGNSRLTCATDQTGSTSGVNLSCTSIQVIKGATVSNGVMTAGTCSTDNSGGTPDAYWDICTWSGGSTYSCATPACAAGYTRIGCSGGGIGGSCNNCEAISQLKIEPYGSSQCSCTCFRVGSTGCVAGECIVYCLKII